MYMLLAYMLPVVGGDALVFVGLYLSWSLTKLLAFIARHLTSFPQGRRLSCRAGRLMDARVGREVHGEE